MSESIRGMTEIIFNITYLILIWLMVVKMELNREKLKHNDRKVGRYLLLAFFLLAQRHIYKRCERDTGFYCKGSNLFIRT
ncbi:hypothetical protein M2651_12325 [Clostridium sp. SYSU_GA19001]|uniref:hypothetical protein n=1 Tax=Clostridium caldaquaticum TaxID=2940653 RepID=UPI0020772B08|nr:hypothetical protein [Clostridium caldaquaticum]MCM8711799.1 hypothetical protein [Clostridium caldaquaticum]